MFLLIWLFRYAPFIKVVSGLHLRYMLIPKGIKELQFVYLVEELQAQTFNFSELHIKYDTVKLKNFIGES